MARVVDIALAAALRPFHAKRAPLIALGIEHEHHSELFLTDILATFAENPIERSMRPSPPRPRAPGPVPFLPAAKGS